MDILDNQLQLGFNADAEEDYLASKQEIDIWEEREAIQLNQFAKKKWAAKWGKQY